MDIVYVVIKHTFPKSILLKGDATVLAVIKTLKAADKFKDTILKMSKEDPNSYSIEISSQRVHENNIATKKP